jgi:H+/gluconate symporter-like permease
VQVLFVNPPVGGVYGYHCRPSFAELMSRGCKCPPPRLTQKEQEKTAGERNKKQETPSDKQTVPAERPSVVRLIVQFVTIMVEQKAKDYDREARQFINQHPEIAKLIIAAGFGAVVALLADDLSIAGIADDVAIPPLLLALWRAAQAL